MEVTDQKQWEDEIKQVKEIYGSPHILVNNAATNELCALPNVDLDQWNKIMVINVTGATIGIQTCAPLMKESGAWGIRSNVICPDFIENTNITKAIEAQSSGQNPLANF